MVKSIKSVLKGIKFVDVAVVVVFVAVMMCLMKKMDVIEGLCMANEVALGNNFMRALYSGDQVQWDRLCSNKSVQECNTINIETGEFYDRSNPSSIGNSSGCILDSPPTPTSDEDSSPCGYLNTDNTCSQQPNCEWYRDNCRQRYPRLGVNWCLDHNLDLGDFGGQEGCHSDDD